MSPNEIQAHMESVEPLAREIGTKIAARIFSGRRANNGEAHLSREDVANIVAAGVTAYYLKLTEKAS